MNDDIPETAKVLLRILNNRSANKYELNWTGTKTPRDFKFGDVIVGWAQNGQIIGVNSESLGFYQDRLKEFGGINKDEHTMIVSTNYKVYDKDGKELIKLSTKELNEDAPKGLKF